MSNPLKKTMVFLGLAEEDLENETQAQPSEQPTQAQPQAVRKAQPEKSAAVTPLRKLQPTRQPAVQGLNEILTVHPNQYSDARVIAENFRDDVPVIMNLSELDESDAKRLVDFAAGLVFGLRGSFDRVTNRVFLLSPANIQVTAEDKAKIAEGGFFNQS